MRCSKRLLTLTAIVSLLGVTSIFAITTHKQADVEQRAQEVTAAIQKAKDTQQMTVQEKKARFVSLVVPAVDHVYNKLQKQYQQVKKMLDAGQDNATIEQLKAKYKVKTNSELLMALKPSPRSIAIAQAAMESSWATSRFFNQANNAFGVWSFNKDEPRIAALGKRDGKTIWVKKYASLEDSITDYYLTLGRNKAFKAFRKAKMETDNPYILVTKLDNYSEKGSKYGEELSSIIKYNKFYKYDEQ